VTDVVQDIRTAKKNEDALKDSKEEEDVLMDRRTVKKRDDVVKDRRTAKMSDSCTEVQNGSEEDRETEKKRTTRK
jgi:hypothetical protein